MSYTKLDSSLTASSIWNEPDVVRIVWITMLSMADKDGNVKAAVPGLAHLARKTLPETEGALAVLMAPDPHSGRKEMEGRRLVTINGGWHLVTHEFYRESGMTDDAKRYWRDKKRKQRMSKNVPDSPRQSGTLGDGTGLESGSGKGSPEGKPFEFSLPAWATDKFRSLFADWMECRKSQGKKPKNWNLMFQKQLDWLADFGEKVAAEVVSKSIRNNYQGLCEPDGRGGKNGTHQGNSGKGSSRTYGTANERRIGQYDNVGKV